MKVRTSRSIMGLLRLPLLLAAAVIAQAGSCGLRMQLTAIPVEQLSISGIDFQQFESRTLLFTIAITSTDINTVAATLHVRLDVNLADGTNLSDPPALEFNTKPFDVPSSGKTITNLNMGHDIAIDGKVEFSQEGKDRLQDVALSTGRFPAGRYKFSISLYRQNVLGNCLSDQSDVEFVIQNSSRVELRSPRDGETTNEFPLFEFFSDAPRS